MRIALTGGTGFLGRYLVHHFSTLGHQVVAWSRREPASLPPDRGVQWIQGELNDPSATRALVSGSDLVIHSGLFRGGESFMRPTIDPIDYWQTNATGSLRLLESAHEAGVKRFVFLSSGAVHDQVLEDRPLDETHPMRPGSLYGAYKASVETLVHHYGRSKKLWTATVRPPSIYGIADPIEQSKWFDLIRRVARGENVEATGGSKTVHAQDIARAITLLLEQDGSISGETFNCCDSMISDFEVATIARQVCGSNAQITGQPKVAKHEIDTTKIRELGMQFGGRPLLRSTIEQLLQAC